jgi:hypothetical protein
MITNLRKNVMGTICFDGQFKSMRKTQKYVAYPLHAGDPTDRLLVQSETRIGYIKFDDGQVTMSPSRAGGSFSIHLHRAVPAGTLTAQELFNVKAAVFATASGKAGSRGIFTDNSGALEVFGAAA